MKPGPPTDSLRRVRVLVNPKSGLGFSFDSFWGIVEEQFGPFGADVSYQFSRDVADGRRKAEGAVRDGVDALIVVGGDGMVNSIGSALVGTPVALGVVPTGSGNGFARHFGIPLDLPGAVRALARSRRRAIDVGAANGRPFFVTCSLAWDAAIVRGFEAFPFRGIVPYVFAAASELIAYEPQPFEVALDGEPAQVFADPVIFTLANLTQYGGGAQIAPQARSDDGQMEMVVVLRQDLPLLLHAHGKSGGQVWRDLGTVGLRGDRDVLSQPVDRYPHQISIPNCASKRTSPSIMSRMSLTPVRNISARSMPMPNANPV